jgi:hypothetical protein
VAAATDFHPKEDDRAAGDSSSSSSSSSGSGSGSGSGVTSLSGDLPLWGGNTDDRTYGMPLSPEVREQVTEEVREEVREQVTEHVMHEVGSHF